MGMSSTFHFGSMETLLFSFWKTESWIGIVLSCVAIVIICFLMESMRWLRVYRKRERLREDAQNEGPRFRRLDLRLITDSVVHGGQLLLSYLLMLIFMTFNVWLCAAVVIGEVIAHLTFRILLPQLERLHDVLSSTETCCG
ncbi:ctr copper transporter [Aphelenchoides avenae]|nr:ctr copper transporter [Aphelenchus avenae]